MAQYGIQPGGMIRLDNGQLWNPNDPLPNDDVGAFNSTPMGSPLNGLGTMAPRATMSPQPQPQPVPQPQLPSPLTPTPSSMSPISTMSGYGSPSLGSSLLQSAMGQAPLATQPYIPPTAPRGMFASSPAAPTAKPSFFGDGGTGRNIAGIIGDALLSANNRPMIYAPQRQKQAEFQKTAYQQQQELVRQLALAQYNNANKDDRTSLQKDAAAAGMQPGTVEYNNFIRQATLAPHYMTIGSPDTGQTVIDASSMSGAGAPASPPQPAIDRLRQNPSEAAKFDEIFGPGASARILGVN